MILQSSEHLAVVVLGAAATCRLGLVTPGTQELKSVGETVLDSVFVIASLSVPLTPLFSTIVVNVVQLQILVNVAPTTSALPTILGDAEFSHFAIPLYTTQTVDLAAFVTEVRAGLRFLGTLFAQTASPDLGYKVSTILDMLGVAIFASRLTGKRLFTTSSAQTEFFELPVALIHSRPTFLSAWRFD